MSVFIRGMKCPTFAEPVRCIAALLDRPVVRLPHQLWIGMPGTRPVPIVGVFEVDQCGVSEDYQANVPVDPAICGELTSFSSFDLKFYESAPVGHLIRCVAEVLRCEGQRGWFDPDHGRQFDLGDLLARVESDERWDGRTIMDRHPE